ncbi:hypothetical protein [Halomarina litorea]|uniref:hypothetical protein n=1 Tax=Halomarina litorea TaxID=2961595 RepID=UPI0020C491AA|nr:hypothetical protein [Halomarina sp. BCD28]
MSRPSRRAFLAACCSTLPPLAGCSSLPDPPGQSPPTETPEEREYGSRETTRRTTRPPREGPDPFYVENYDDRAYCLSLSVTRGDETLVDGKFRLEPGSGLTFTAVGELETTHEVRASLASGESVSAEWYPVVCPGRYRGSGANRAGGILVNRESLSFGTNHCDAVSFGHAVETYRVDPASDDCSGDVENGTRETRENDSNAT